MSTRAQIRFATREDGVSFNEHPKKHNARFYRHSDGYPEGLGLDIAKSILDNVSVGYGWEIEHVQTLHGDLEYIYYVWSDYDKETWISIFECHPFSNQISECIFVGTPEKLIETYSQTENE
jgi:hypothetical protein